VACKGRETCLATIHTCYFSELSWATPAASSSWKRVCRSPCGGTGLDWHAANVGPLSGDKGEPDGNEEQKIRIQVGHIGHLRRSRAAISGKGRQMRLYKLEMELAIGMAMTEKGSVVILRWIIPNV
jgi:hypothetical protein